MTTTVEVEVDALGNIRPLESSVKLPQGRAQLTWKSEPTDDEVLLAYSSFGEGWLRPEEDEAWAYLQPDK